tara:strand:- start:275 stop:493 length:219 start_codon:yes stop_codon:yes gene_type:complete
MAINKKLSELHTLLADDLTEKIKSGEAKAGDLNVARQFLKDNEITALPTNNNSLQNLLDAMPFDEKEAKELN